VALLTVKSDVTVSVVDSASRMRQSYVRTHCLKTKKKNMRPPTTTILLLLVPVLGDSSSAVVVVSSFALLIPTRSPAKRAIIFLQSSTTARDDDDDNGRCSPLIQLRGGAVITDDDDATQESLLQQKDYSGEAANLLGNLRIPAALFAGAAAGGAFALPLVTGEGLQVGMVKRLYALLMVGALSAQVIAITVATVTMADMSAASTTTKKTRSVAEYLNQNYDLEWVTARLHFLSGMLLFVIGSGLRAWITIGCPVIAKVALGIIVSGTLLALSFIDSVERAQFSKKGMIALPVRFVKLLLERVRKFEGPWFLASLVSAVVTAVYLVSKLEHITSYLIKTSV